MSKYGVNPIILLKIFCKFYKIGSWTENMTEIGNVPDDVLFWKKLTMDEVDDWVSSSNFDAVENIEWSLDQSHLQFPKIF